jgi:prolyl-tRNA synthetase
MRHSRSFLPTLKDVSADAVVPSHRLLLRAGLVRQLGAGIYSFLPLGLRALRKVERIIREEMEAIGAQEFLLPALHPAELWQESGRWEVMGDNMFRLKDRKGGDYCLGMTHEEVFCAVARAELRSYRDLPQVWYQIQNKFRDEPRPKSGLLRVRQFTMKDAYSFDLDTDGLDRSFEDQRAAYWRIFQRCGLDCAAEGIGSRRRDEGAGPRSDPRSKQTLVAVDADSGSMGGSASTEFMVRTDAGEDHIAACRSCGYAANTEKATSRLPPSADPPGPSALARFATPGVRTIEQLEAAPYGVPAARQLKTLVYVADVPVIAVIRGDDQLHETKLQNVLGASEVRPAHPEEIGALLGALPGSLGGVGTQGKARLLLDRTLAGARDRVTGANVDGYHLTGVDVERDLAHAELCDLRTVRDGEGCPRCDGTLEVFKGLEIGHIFKLGTKYSRSMGAMVLDRAGASVPVVMGSYGIGVDRIVAAAIELHHDEHGIRWPLSIAPLQVSLLSLQPNEPEVVAAADALYAELVARGVEVLYDDRDERPGVKFKDADLIGLPIRIAVGRKSLAEGHVEWKRRDSAEVQMVPVAEVVARAVEAVSA